MSSYSGCGQIINTNDARISGSGHKITGNSNRISGSGHVINGNYNKISGSGHVINGKDNEMSGAGHVVNGKNWTAGRSSSGITISGGNTITGDGCVFDSPVTFGGRSTHRSSPGNTFTSDARGIRNTVVIDGGASVGNVDVSIGCIDFAQTGIARQVNHGSVSNWFGGFGNVGNTNCFNVGGNVDITHCSNVGGNVGNTNCFNVGNQVVSNITSGGNVTIKTKNGGKGSTTVVTDVSSGGDITVSMGDYGSDYFYNGSGIDGDRCESERDEPFHVKEVKECKVPDEATMRLDEEISLDEDVEKDACIVCFERRRRCTVRPCGHFILCVTCSRTMGLLPTPKCPTCSTEAESFDLTWT